MNDIQRMRLGLLAMALVFCLLPSAFGQPAVPPPQPATQAETDAGVVTRKYVSPATLAAYSLAQSTGSISSATATNIAAYQAQIATNNYAGTVTNISKGAFTNGTPVFGKFNLLLGTNVFNPAATTSNNIFVANDMAANFLATGSDMVFIGGYPNSGGVSGNGGVAIGSGAGAGANAVSVGWQSDAFGDGSVSIGGGISGDGQNQIQIGYGGSSASLSNIILIGRGLSASVNNQAIIGDQYTTNMWLRGYLYGNGYGLTNIWNLTNVIAGGVNTTGKVDWSQLRNVPAGFADGTDDGAGGGSQTPWATDIQAAEHILYDVAAVMFRDTGGSGSIQSSDGSSSITVGNGSLGMVYNVSDPGVHTFYGPVSITNLNSSLSLSALATMNANATIANGATSAGVLKLMEDSDDGSNFASFQVPALAANTVYTLPTTDGNSGQYLQTDGSGTLTWADASASSTTFWFTNSAAASSVSNAYNVKIAGDLSVTGTASVATNNSTNMVFVGRSNALMQITSTGALETNSLGAVPVNGDGTATTFTQMQTAAARTFTTNNATLTSGRVQVGDGGRGVANATASGAVPIDADGTATTFAQVNALAPNSGASYIFTNGLSVTAQLSNSLRLSALSYFYPTNVTAGKVLTVTTAGGLTNSGLGAVPINGDTTATTAAQVNTLFPTSIATNGATPYWVNDDYTTNAAAVAAAPIPSFALGNAMISTNADFSFATTVAGWDGTKAQTTVLVVSNAAKGSLMTVTVPAVYKQQGTMNVTNNGVTVFTFYHYGAGWTNCRGTPLF